jgi:hypothetical protein
MLITSRGDPFCMGPVEVPTVCNLCHYKLWLDSIAMMYTILSSFLSFQLVLLVIKLFYHSWLVLCCVLMNFCGLFGRHAMGVNHFR